MKGRTVHTLAGHPDDTRQTDCGRSFDDVRNDVVISRALARLVTCPGCRDRLLVIRAQEVTQCDA